MEFSPVSLALMGLVLAAWTVGAAWLVLSARAQARKARMARRSAERLSGIIDQSPAIPMMVHADGRVEAPARLAGWLGLSRNPRFLSELTEANDNSGLSEEDLARIEEAILLVRKSATSFQMVITPANSSRSLGVQGELADPAVSTAGSAILWWYDFTDSHQELERLSQEVDRSRRDFAALVGLIEAAPIPMWFRGRDMKLHLVNRAYAEAVGALSPDSAVAHQMELIEPVDGVTAADIARRADADDRIIARTVGATFANQRRMVRVSDLPLGDEGVAGYAVDIEDIEEQARKLRAYREAQRSMIDELSIGVAQFDTDKRFDFANGPFRRIFSLNAQASESDPLDFDRFLDTARDAGCLPEVRDFPNWRKEARSWFTSDSSVKDSWSLSDGRHLIITAHPMPDGGLVLIAEDQSEELALSAIRDTLLRTRTATFDSLFESLAVFAPDGRLQLWNRRFGSTWDIPEDYLDEHPRLDEMIKLIEAQLDPPEQVRELEDAVRVATLDRLQRNGEITLNSGRIFEFAGVPLPDGNGLLTLLDVTDSRHSEDALRERTTALEEADAVKTRFLANMSYEFRTPLTSIGGFAELLQNGVAGELPEQASEYVAAIIESVDRLSSQIETVLDMSQSEAGLLPITAEEVEVLPFVTAIVRDREADLEARELTLDLRGDSSAGIIEADEKRLARAIGNIVDNAIAASPRGGRILVTLKRKSGKLEIAIADSGVGMSGGELARALDGYLLNTENADDSRRRSLGLPLARHLIAAHGGRLELTSEKGVGTKATITLP
ncbi:PAS domain-containing sensor histidine kinase [Altericroceibacterium endophyticum]|uniref:histidine kinase n=1 Tax=Altericroceibacterium endophyticum TaxID=1808508 RepID=A0A6I4T4X4_9SPHN|nr:PAS domain-containing sensor histidine kinase [Altericroceibacterium endophyticum]MXO64735.1 histidine kinase [Altericroceibacterium endophyticum]